MNKVEYLSHVDRLFTEYLAFWKTICGMETPSHDRDALNRQADYIEAFCLERGFSVYRQTYEKAGDTLLVELPGSPLQAPVALLAHMDTVHEKGAFGPVPVREQHGILYGPGVFDCKGGIAVSLLAMDALKQSGVRHRTVRLILNSDEESGAYIGAAGVSFIKEAAKGCAAAFNCESGCSGALTVGRKGIIKAQVTVKGVSGHAGNAYFSSVSAVREAAYKIIALEESSEQDGITFNCGVVAGGTSANVVPDACDFQVDIRFKDAAQRQRAMRRVEEVVSKSYVSGSAGSVRVLSCRPAMEAGKSNLDLFHLVAGAAQELGLEELTPMERGGGSDSAYTVEAGVPTVCSMGPIGRFEHTVREEADIKSLSSRAKILMESILRM